MLYRNRLKKLGLTQMVMNELKKPEYPSNFKGRHKKDLITNILKFF